MNIALRGKGYGISGTEIVFNLEMIANPYRKLRHLLSVYFGSVSKYEYHLKRSVETYFIHPSHDLALIRLEIEVKAVEKQDYYLINGICIPKDEVYNTAQEYAIVCGFGTIDIRNQIPSLVLRKANITIDPSTDCWLKNFSIYKICATEDKHMTCYVRVISFYS